MDDAGLAGLKARLGTFGVDAAAMRRVAQTPEQLAALEISESAAAR